MTDPKRWLEDAGASASLEARVLGVALAERPPAGLADRAWADFVARVGPLAPAAREPHEPTADPADLVEGGRGALELASSSAGTALAAGVIKATGAGVLLGVLTMTAVQVLGPTSVSRAPAGVAPAPAASSSVRGVARASEPARVSFPTSGAAEREAPSVAPGKAGLRASEASGPLVGASPNMQALPQDRGEAVRENTAVASGVDPLGTQAARAAFPVASEGESVAPFPSSAVRAPATDSQLKAEALELAQAKNLLQQGRAAEAEALLVRGSQRFANGALSGERELLIVQALSRLGREAEARRRAQAFLARYPGGPISARMQRLVGPK